MPVREDYYYSTAEESEDIEPYREYRGEVTLANSSYEFALGGDIVPAGEYYQGTHGFEAAYVDAGEVPSEPEAAVFVSREKLPQRTVDDMLDPYGSPMLEGFVQTEFEPVPVVEAFDKHGKPIYPKVD